MSRHLQKLARTAAQRSGPRISVDWQVMAGRPCVAGSRIPVQTVISHLADNLSSDALVGEYPELTVDDVRACLAHAYAVLDLLGDATQTLQVPGSFDQIRRAMDNDRRRGTMTQSTERSDR